MFFRLCIALAVSLFGVASSVAQPFLPNQVLTAAALNAALAAPIITGGTINGSVIGLSNPAGGGFTTLTTAGTSTFNGGLVRFLGASGVTIGDNTSVQPFVVNGFIAPIGGLLTPAVLMQGNAFGTITSGALSSARVMNINADSVNADGAQGGGFYGLYMGHVLSAGARGGRTTLFSLLTQTAATVPGDNFYVAQAAFADANSSAGGAAGFGLDQGQLFANNFSSILKTGAGLYWGGVVGSEINVSAQVGTGVTYKVGLQVVKWLHDAVQANAVEAALAVINQSGGTATGWKQALIVGGNHGWWPIDPAGDIVGLGAVNVHLGAGPPIKAGYGINFIGQPISFATAAFASPGFLVDGAGQMTLGPATLGWSAAGLVAGAVGQAAVLSGVAAGGTGHVVGSILKDTHGGLWEIATAPAGVLATLTMLKAPTITSGSAPANPRALSGGVGVGATINLTWSAADRVTLTGRVVLASSATPASASAACVAGERAWDASFIYSCIAPNTWKRAAVATW